MSILTADFRHITILYSDDGEPWCQFILQHLLQPALKLRVETLNLDKLSYESPPELLVSLQESYVTFVLMTAGLIDYMEGQSSWMSAIFHPHDGDVNTVMAVTCHVDLDEIINVCIGNNYNHSCWDFNELKMDASNISNILERALSFVDGNKIKRNGKLDKNEELLLSNRFCELFPSKVQIGDKVAVAFTCSIEADVTMIINRKEVMLEMINPYCAVCTVPPIPFGIHTATILIDGEIKAKSKLEHTPFTPTSIDVLMQALNVWTKEDLDNLFAEQFSQSVCNEPMLQKVESAALSQSQVTKTGSRYPTQIHWAAANGLKELCSQMLMTTAGTSACCIRNCDNENAADLAGSNNHLELKDYINDFLETQLYVDACNLYVQGHCLTDDSIYEDMSSPKPPPIPTRKTLAAIGRSMSADEIPHPTKPRKRLGSEEISSPGLSLPNQRPPDKEFMLSEAAVGCRSQNELIDIMEDFKKGDFTVGEVEMLFQSWKQRYNSGKAISFKEKQRVLEDLRTQNKRIFASKTNRQLKNPTIQEEYNLPSISEPIVPRKPAIGPSSKRTKDARGGDAKTSSSSASHDSGLGSAQIDEEEMLRTSDLVMSQKAVTSASTKKVKNLSAIDRLERSPPGSETSNMSQSLRGRREGRNTDSRLKRKSHVEVLKELELRIEDSQPPPPLPPRTVRKPKVYSKTKQK